MRLRPERHGFACSYQFKDGKTKDQKTKTPRSWGRWPGFQEGLFGQAADFLVPSLQQAAAFGGFAVFFKVVFDQAHLVHGRDAWIGFEGFVGRALQAVGFAADALACRAHEPVVVTLGIGRVARALHQGDATDFVAGAFAGGRAGDGVFLVAPHVKTKDEADAHGHFAFGHIGRLRGAAAGV